MYTDVKRKDGSFKDTHNYIVTAERIEGPWSDPIYINSSGFDPSLFHDDDGRKWFVNMLQDHRRRPRLFAGIRLQEFDSKAERLVGPAKTIFYGTELDLVEGPHLYKRNGWYYLLTAEGGTAYEHACTLARSRNIWGPYELHPQKHILTSKDAPLASLQRAGHGDLVETPDGKTYLVYVECIRLIPLKHANIALNLQSSRGPPNHASSSLRSRARNVYTRSTLERR